MSDSDGEVMNRQSWRTFCRMQGSGAINLFLTSRDQWHLSEFTVQNVDGDKVEEQKASTLKERKEKYLQMLAEREREREGKEKLRDTGPSKAAPKHATVEDEEESEESSESSDDHGRTTGLTSARRAAGKPRLKYLFYSTADTRIPPHALEESAFPNTQDIYFQPAFLWRGPASTTTSPRAKAAVAKAVSVVPSNKETKLDESLFISLHQSLAASLESYRDMAVCTSAEMQEAQRAWQERIVDAEIGQLDPGSSLALSRAFLSRPAWLLFKLFAGKDDDSLLTQKYRAAIIHLTRVRSSRYWRRLC